MNAMTDILSFLWAVINSWAGYATGGLVVATFGLYFVWKDKPMPKAIGLSLAAVFLLMACYKAWKEQRDTTSTRDSQIADLRGEIESLKKAIADLNQPDLHPKIYGVATGQDGTGNAVITINVQIVNKGAASGVPSLSAEIYASDGAQLRLTEVVPPMGNIHFHGMNGDPDFTMTLVSENFLPRVLSKGPIARGGDIFGWVIFALNVKPETVRKAGTTVIFKCTDFNGKEYGATYKETGIPTSVYDPIRSGAMKPGVP